MKITLRTPKGGAVEFNKRHGAWASYSTANVNGNQSPEILYAGARIANGKSVQFFMNRKTGVIVVDLINRDGTHERELCRAKV